MDRLSHVPDVGEADRDSRLVAHRDERSPAGLSRTALLTQRDENCVGTQIDDACGAEPGVLNGHRRGLAWGTWRAWWAGRTLGTGKSSGPVIPWGTWRTWRAGRTLWPGNSWLARLPWLARETWITGWALRPHGTTRPWVALARDCGYQRNRSEQKNERSRSRAQERHHEAPSSMVVGRYSKAPWPSQEGVLTHATAASGHDYTRNPRQKGVQGLQSRRPSYEYHFRAVKAQTNQTQRATPKNGGNWCITGRDGRTSCGR